MPKLVSLLFLVFLMACQSDEQSETKPSNREEINIKKPSQPTEPQSGRQADKLLLDLSLPRENERNREVIDAENRSKLSDLFKGSDQPGAIKLSGKPLLKKGAKEPGELVEGAEVQLEIKTK